MRRSCFGGPFLSSVQLQANKIKAIVEFFCFSLFASDDCKAERKGARKYGVASHLSSIISVSGFNSTD
jgi:hypothetical protein